MHSGAGYLTARIQSIEISATTQIGDDPTHHVVRGRCYRNEILRWIHSTRSADCEDARKSFLEHGTEHPRIQPDVLSSSLLPKDLARDDITRSELRQAMTLEHESLA